MTVSVDSFNGVHGCVPSYPGWGQTTYRIPTTKKRVVTTVTEYDEEGRVVKVTTTEETVDSAPNYQPYYTYNDFTVTASGEVDTANAIKDSIKKYSAASN